MAMKLNSRLPNTGSSNLSIASARYSGLHWTVAVVATSSSWQGGACMSPAAGSFPWASSFFNCGYAATHVRYFVDADEHLNQSIGSRPNQALMFISYTDSPSDFCPLHDGHAFRYYSRVNLHEYGPWSTLHRPTIHGQCALDDLFLFTGGHLKTIRKPT